MRALRRLPVIALLALVGACGAPAALPTSTPAGSPTPTTQASPPSSQAVASTSPTQTPEPTVEPTLEPERTPEPIDGSWAQDPPTPLLIGAAVRVLISELNVREQPSISARRVGTATPEDILAVGSVPPVEAAD
ncbi:MAG: hypothetical protein L0221_19300, partial [Chloroflexi bacterium]|nr:hypothetical protein [Chloroflexota bacterium]